MKNYLVSVRLMTYNHEPFIREAIESVLRQKANFDIEVVIGDDFSTDNTLAILKQYNGTGNIHIKILDREIGDAYWKKRKEKGRLYNFSNIVENCTGKYIALLDGDDYWTDVNKLKKQVEFLESNPSYSMCFHQADLLFEDGSIKKCNDFVENSVFEFKDLINKNFVSTASCLYRNHYNPLPDWFHNLRAGDWGLHLLNAERGKIYYMKDTMSVYRMHNQGFWSKLPFKEVEQRNIANLQILNKVFQFKYNTEFEKAINARVLKLQELERKNSFLNVLKSKIKRIVRAIFGSTFARFKIGL